MGSSEWRAEERRQWCGRANRPAPANLGAPTGKLVANLRANHRQAPTSGRDLRLSLATVDRNLSTPLQLGIIEPVGRGATQLVAARPTDCSAARLLKVLIDARLCALSEFRKAHRQIDWLEFAKRSDGAAAELWRKPGSPL